MNHDKARWDLLIEDAATDPARVRQSDPGEPTKCDVYSLHMEHSNQETVRWAAQGCRTAGISCYDCKLSLHVRWVAEAIAAAAMAEYELQEKALAAGLSRLEKRPH